jgi:hypothetical protein
MPTRRIRERELEVGEWIGLAAQIKMKVDELWEMLFGRNDNPSSRELDDIMNEGQKKELFALLADSLEHIDVMTEIVFGAETLEMLEQIRQSQSPRGL